MERIRITIAIVLILSALRKFEDMVAQYGESIEAGGLNIECYTCILGTTGLQAPSHIQSTGLIPPVEQIHGRRSIAEQHAFGHENQGIGSVGRDLTEKEDTCEKALYWVGNRKSVQ